MPTIDPETLPVIVNIVITPVAVYLLWYLIHFAFRLAFSPINAKWFTHGLIFLLVFIYLCAAGLHFLLGYEISALTPRVFMAIVFTGVNIVVVPFLYWYDKRAANTENAIRIPEIVLHFFAFLSGALSALVCQRIYRHKVRKFKFQIITYLALIVNLALLYILIIECPLKMVLT